MAEEGRTDDPGSHSWAAAAAVDCHYTLECSRCCYCCRILDYTEPDSGSGPDVDTAVGSAAGDRPAARICLLHPSYMSN